MSATPEMPSNPDPFADDHEAPEAAADLAVEVSNLTVSFDTRFGTIRAVNDISFRIGAAETLGLIGESGCGKSTTGRAVAALPPPPVGTVLVQGRDLAEMSPGDLRANRHRVQLIFQDPTASLNPRESVREGIERALAIQRRAPRAERAERADDVLELVGLDPGTYGQRRPHELSGGQCQRAAIARALVVGPEVVVCDEAVSALDVSIQAQVLNLLRRLKAERGHSMLFISHDLAAVKNISDRIAVMYLGTLCEVAAADDLVDEPAHPYTALLIASVPGEAVTPVGDYGDEPPNALQIPPGCVFSERCPRVSDRCRTERPGLTRVSDTHWVACHHPLTEAA